MCQADGRLCDGQASSRRALVCVSFDKLQLFLRLIGISLLICADAKLLLVMGMDDNVIESTITSTLLMLC